MAEYIDKVCAECEECWYYYTNSDTENVCNGDLKPCFEFEPLPWNRRVKVALEQER